MPASAESTPTKPDGLDAAVLAALSRVIDPEIRRPITELDMIESVSVVEGAA